MKSVPRMCRKHPGERAVGLSSLCVACTVNRIAAKREKREERAAPVYRLTRAASTKARAPVRAAPKAEPYRDRTELDLAHAIHFCTNCEGYAMEGCEPSHANGADWGKGLGRKADDWAHAALCHACHRFLDQGGAPLDPSGRFACTRQDRREMWTRAYFETQTQYHRNGWVGVIKTKGNR